MSSDNDDLFSVGLLYDFQELEDIASGGASINLRTLSAGIKAIRVASIQSIIQLIEITGWATMRSDGELLLRQNVTSVSEAGGPAYRLRTQLLKLIICCRPTWGALLQLGRTEVKPYVRANVLQCFEEAGLLEGGDAEIAAWWLAAAAPFRTAPGNDDTTETGLLGESLSVYYETWRTGKVPIWQSIDSCKSGFDLLSICEKYSDKWLPIEVKASRDPRGRRPLVVSKNEWKVAKQSSEYLFHLWLISEYPRLFVVPTSEMGKHIPKEQGLGRWESAAIEYKAFSNTFEVVLPEEVKAALRAIVRDHSVAAERQLQSRH